MAGKNKLFINPKISYAAGADLMRGEGKRPLAWEGSGLLRLIFPENCEICERVDFQFEAFPAF